MLEAVQNYQRDDAVQLFVNSVGHWEDPNATILSGVFDFVAQ